MKLYFVTSLMFAVVITLMAIAEDKKTRLMFLAASLILFYSTLFLFSLEYDKQSISNWKKKEKKLIEDTYLRFVQEHHKKKA